MTEHWGHLLPARDEPAEPTPEAPPVAPEVPAGVDGSDVGEVAAELELGGGGTEGDQNEDGVLASENPEGSSGSSPNGTPVETQTANLDTLVSEREAIMQLDLSYLSSTFFLWVTYHSIFFEIHVSSTHHCRPHPAGSGCVPLKLPSICRRQCLQWPQLLLKQACLYRDYGWWIS